MQTLSQTRKMAKHQHDTKTQQPKKKTKTIERKNLGIAPLDLVGFQKDVGAAPPEEVLPRPR